uniref:NADH-ubiquinone oxidoreductase chain 6 n=2 Tax=Monochamus alternatus TaxID=192382 RepID=K9Y6X3_MONAT|nr:NADH dehydrogenase subunit 6 [Monochamus alternatus alternatus]AFZ40842.1 NADH dehydrogenase subunit 6 [Monochamus alternatus]QLM01488.1 NADH dehydrogenase subunit 6 [Monochamus alternatus alternatus]QWM97282.1 NADH dehydrogenase subunit 6 [Monochamus alternatus]
MSLIFISLSIIMGFSFLFLNHPLSLGLILLFQTTLIALITGLMNYNYWFSYIIFLVMIGGMLILFIYMTSVASNEKFKFSYKLMSILTILFCMLFLLMFLDSYYFNLILTNDLINQNFNMNFKLSMNKFLMWPMNLLFTLIIIYLLITLIMVVKITNIQSGPLRQKL